MMQVVGRTKGRRTWWPLSPGRTTWLLVALLLVIPGGYAAALLFRGTNDPGLLIDGVFGITAICAPAVVTWSVVCRARGRTTVLLLVASALSCWAVGAVYLGVRLAMGASVPIPSPAHYGYIGFYILLTAAVVTMVKERVHAMTWPVILDSVVGALGAAAVLVVAGDYLLNPVREVLSGTGAVLVLGYPLMDLVLISAAIGIVATTGGVTGDGLAFLGLGLVTLAMTHLTTAVMGMSGQYILGTPMDASWALGLSLISAWAILQHGGHQHRFGRHFKVPVQTVPALATAAGLGVLVLASQQEVTLLAVVLAALTLALAALPLVFRHRLRLSLADQQARTDELTGLPNRRALHSDVPLRLSASKNRRSAVLLLDLNKFKEINDGLGHDVGDRLLIQVAERLAGQLRPVDLLTRMGGDEFVIHLADCGPDEAEAVAVKLRATLAEPFDLGGTTVHVNASIGISWSPSQGSDLNLLLRKADMAMYAAKSTHSGYALYSESDAETASHEFLDVQSLNDALNDDQLTLHFQPKIDLATGQVRGVEALVRWNHPRLGLLQPDTFLKRFEETGLMPALTSVVLTQSLDQAAVWTARGQPLSVAVNLSASSVMDAQLSNEIEEMISSRGLPPSVLVLEITEDVLIADRDRVRTTLTALRSMGVRIAVDDFGKGYSSLSYLRELPIDELKLDKSFIFTMMKDARATALVVSTIDLAHSLGLEMTAEGVEDTEAYRALTDYGCDLAQGYFMSRPVSAAELDTWLRNRATGTDPQNPLDPVGRVDIAPAPDDPAHDVVA